MLERLVGSVCLVSALMLLAGASWLFIVGPSPGMPLGNETYMIVGPVSINGYCLPDWTFYFLPIGLCAISLGLLFLGSRLVRAKPKGL